MQYTTLHDIKRIVTKFENSVNKANIKTSKSSKTNGKFNVSNTVSNNDISLFDNYAIQNND